MDKDTAKTNTTQISQDESLPNETRQSQQQDIQATNIALNKSDELPKNISDNNGSRSALLILLGFFTLPFIAGVLSDLLYVNYSNRKDIFGFSDVATVYLPLSLQFGLVFALLVLIGLSIYKNVPKSIKKVVGLILNVIGWSLVFAASFFMYSLVTTLNDPGGE